MRIYRRMYVIALLFLSATLACQPAFAAPMRSVKYLRYEFHFDPEAREAKLSTFVYDIPYFGACGIFPPRHIANQIFSKGGGDGGMSPGASWTPFELSEAEYRDLAAVIEKLNPQTLGSDARFTHVKFEFDSAFDSIQDKSSWLKAVCEKHRSEFHLKLEKLH